MRRARKPQQRTANPQFPDEGRARTGGDRVLPQAGADRAVARAQRDALRERLLARGIETALHYPIPMHRQPLFRTEAVETEVTLPCAEKACEEILSLPFNAEMTDAEVDAVCHCLRE